MEEIDRHQKKFSKTKESTLHVIQNADAAFLLCGAECRDSAIGYCVTGHKYLIVDILPLYGCVAAAINYTYPRKFYMCDAIDKKNTNVKNDTAFWYAT